MDDGSPEKRETDAARFEALFHSHYRDVEAYVRRRAEPDLVEDVVAETFLVAWRRLDELPDEARPWLLSVARRTLSTQRRSGARRRSLVREIAAQPPVESGGQQIDLGVAEALARLSERDREAITLVAWEGLSPQEAAAVVGQSAVAFRVRLHRAKRRLRERIDSSSWAPSVVPRELRVSEGEAKR